MANVNTRKEPAIYALHLGDHRYRYVGATTVNSQNRLYQHICRAQQGHNAPVYRWMREVGIRNVMVTDLYRVDDVSELDGLEVCAIVKLLGEGFELVNHSWAKGNGYQVRSAEYQRGFRPPRSKGRKPKEPKRRPVEHGTRTMADKYKCKCDPCRLVMAQRNASRRGRPIPTSIDQLRLRS